MPAPTRRFVAALVLALLAVVVPITAGGTALAGPTFPGPSAVAPDTRTSSQSTVPEPATSHPVADGATGPGTDAPSPVESTAAGTTPIDAGAPVSAASDPDPEPVAAGPHATPTGRAATPDSPAPGAPAPPGPVLDALIPTLPTPPGTGPDDLVGAHHVTPGPDTGHGAVADPRGPPVA